MSESNHYPRPDRPAVPSRDGFCAQRAFPAPSARPVVVVPDRGKQQTPAKPQRPPRSNEPDWARSRAARDLFRAYGERSSSRPYALRLPEPVDKVLRHIAAEERMQPLRIIDRAIFDYLKRLDRLPPADERCEGE